jgi:hypothetical protein
MAAYTEPGVGANAVGWGRGRGSGSDVSAAREERHGFENIFRTLRNSVRKYCLGTMSESFALSAVLRRRRVRNMSVVQASPLARSASAQVT